MNPTSLAACLLLLGVPGWAHTPDPAPVLRGLEAFQDLDGMEPLELPAPAIPAGPAAQNAAAAVRVATISPRPVAEERKDGLLGGPLRLRYSVPAPATPIRWFPAEQDVRNPHPHHAALLSFVSEEKDACVYELRRSRDGFEEATIFLGRIEFGFGLGPQETLRIRASVPGHAVTFGLEVLEEDQTTWVDLVPLTFEGHASLPARQN